MTATLAVEVRNDLGLHARPAAAFADAAGHFDSRVVVEHDGRSVDAASVLLVLTLDVRQGDRITLTADGPDEDQAVAALAQLVARP